MLESSSISRRTGLSIFAALGLLLLICQPAEAEAQSLPPLRIPNLAVGTRCFGLLPCTAIDPFGIRLRAAVLAVFRPEKGHDRDLYAARIQIAPSVTLFQWGEIGVAIPITLYTKDVGVSPVYEPLQPFGRVRLPFDAMLGSLATTAFVRVHIAQGPFVGGLPPLRAASAAASPMPDFMAQALQPYRAQTQFELGLALQKRIGPVTAAGSLGASVAAQRVEIYGGAEVAYHFKVFQAFVQGMGVGVPRCPPEETALNFCARGFRFGAGVRFDFDIGQGGLMVGTGSGAVEPGWMVGTQLGLDYDETVRRMHGDGTGAAHAWWERRFEAMAQGWAAWKSAAVVWDDEDEAVRRVRPSQRGPFSGLLPGGAPPPSSPWLDALLGDDIPPAAPLLQDPQTGAATPAPGAKAPGPQEQRGRPGPGRKPPQKSLLAAANARAALQRQLARPPQFKLPGSIDVMTDEELARGQWHVIQEELRCAEQQKWRDASPLPPMEKVILNWVATAPARGVLGLLAMSGPGRRAEAEEQMRKLRPLKCTPAEEEACSAVEGMFDAMATMLTPSAAEAVAAERAMVALARQGAREAGQAAEFAAAAKALGVAEESGIEAAELGGSRVSQFLASVRDRLNPTNYEVNGLGSNFGNVRYRGPRLAAPTSTAAEVAETEAVHAELSLLPRAEEVQVDARKFVNYSLDPGNTANKGKWKAFDSLGYDVHTEAGRAEAAQDLTAQIQSQLRQTSATPAKESIYGQRFEVRVPIEGPNGNKATLVTEWQIDKGSDTPRLITNWAEVHK